MAGIDLARAGLGASHSPLLQSIRNTLISSIAMVYRLGIFLLHYMVASASCKLLHAPHVQAMVNGADLDSATHSSPLVCVICYEKLWLMSVPQAPTRAREVLLLLLSTLLNWKSLL